MASSAVLDTTVPQPPRWIARRDVSPLERMPRLASIMADTAQAWTQGFAELSTTPVEMTCGGIETCRIESLASHSQAGRTVAIVEAKEWGAELAVLFERDCVVTMVEALFGGEGDETALDPAEPLSPLERQIGELMVRRVADAMKVGFAALLPTTFRFDRVLAKPDLACLGKPATVLMQARLSVRTLGRVVWFDVLMPQAALEPFAAQLAEPDVVATVTADPRWSRRLEAEVGRAMTALQATIDIPNLDLGALARLVPGQILRLPIGAGSTVKLACGDDDLFRCELGQSAGRYTLRIDEPIGAPATQDRQPDTHLPGHS